MEKELDYHAAHGGRGRWPMLVWALVGFVLGILAMVVVAILGASRLFWTVSSPVEWAMLHIARLRNPHTTELAPIPFLCVAATYWGAFGAVVGVVGYVLHTYLHHGKKGVRGSGTDAQED